MSAADEQIERSAQERKDASNNGLDHTSESDTFPEVVDEDALSAAKFPPHKIVSIPSATIVSIESGFIKICNGNVILYDRYGNSYVVLTRSEKETEIVKDAQQDEERELVDHSPLHEVFKPAAENEEDDQITPKTKYLEQTNRIPKSLVALEYSEDMTADSDSDFN